MYVCIVPLEYSKKSVFTKFMILERNDSRKGFLALVGVIHHLKRKRKYIF